MKTAERFFGHVICWGLTAILAAVNIAYLKTLGDVEIFGGREVTRNFMIAASILVDGSLILSTSRMMHHLDRRAWARALATLALWLSCAVFSGHSAYNTVLMLGSAATSKADAGANAKADKRDDLKRAKDNLAAIQAELRKAAQKRRGDELRGQEDAAKADVSRLETEVSTLPAIVSSTPVKGFEFYVAAVIIGLPVLVVIATSERRETPTPAAKNEPIREPEKVDIVADTCPPATPPDKPDKKRTSPLDRQARKCPQMSTAKRKKNNVVQFKRPSRKEVDKLLSERWTQKAIAEHFGVSTKTVQRILREAEKITARIV